MPELLSIIIPTYNEAARIGSTLERIFAFLDSSSLNAELVLVNDGSSDATTDIVARFASSHPNLRIINNPGNRGKGYSVRNGMLNSRGDVLLFTDADLSSPIEEARKLIEAIAAGADVAFGSRWIQTEMQTERQPVLRQIAGRAYNLLARVLLGLNYKDTQCGFKAFTRAAAQTIFTRQRIERWGFDPELLFIARKFHMKMAEVPVRWAHDNRSKINPVLDGIKMFSEMLSIRLADFRGLYARPEFQFPAAESGALQEADKRQA